MLDHIIARLKQYICHHEFRVMNPGSHGLCHLMKCRKCGAFHLKIKDWEEIEGEQK